LARQAELIRAAKANGMTILTVEYKDCGTTCKALKAEVGDYPQARTFIKDTDGLFYDNQIKAELKDYLKTNSVTDLVMTGANGGACVKCTIEGAIQEGYKVWADSRAIGDFNNKDFIYPYRYDPKDLYLKGSLATQNFNQGENLSLSEILNAGARSPTLRLAGGAALGVAPIVAGGFTAAYDAQVRRDVAAGACPSGFLIGPNTAEVSNELMAYDLAQRNKVAAACGAKMNFSSALKKLKAEPNWGWSQARCDSKGNVKLIHNNGSTSVIHFVKAENSVSPDSISAHVSSRNPDSEEGIGIQFSQKGDKWFGTNASGQIDMETDWKSSIRKFHAALDDKAVPSFTTNERRAVALVVAREALGLVPGSTITYESACKELGGQIPTDEVSYDSPAAKPRAAVVSIGDPDTAT
jgi:hypothetical protein